jgi:hypothetical protein
VDAGLGSTRNDSASGLTSWFRFGDGYLGLRSDQAVFRDRFASLYHECRVDSPGQVAALVRCSVATLEGGRRIRVAFDDPEPLDLIPFALSALADFGYAEEPSPEPGRRILRSSCMPGALWFEPEGFLADANGPWPTMTSILAVHRVLRLQRDTLFFHAAAVGIHGRGLLLMGPKEAGKTTLSLALAENGHQFFSDEMSAIRRDSLEILPFRRRLSIRRGPAAPGVRQALEGRPFEVVQLDDGTDRTRAQPADLVPDAPPEAVRGRAIFFLGPNRGPARGGRV